MDGSAWSNAHNQPMYDAFNPQAWPNDVMVNDRLSLGNEIYNSWPGLQDETGRISTPLDEDLFMQDSSPHQNGETDGSNAIGFQHIASGFASQQGDNFLLGSDESLGGQAGASAQIYSEPGVASDNICYGMIHKVDVKLVGEMSSLKAELTQSQCTSRRPVHVFTMKLKHDHIALQGPSGVDRGLLRGNTWGALSELVRQQDLEFEPVAPYRALQQTINSVHNKKDAVIHADINVYGPRNRATETGEKLSKEKMWLQRPDYSKPGCEYMNPHIIRFPDEENLMAHRLEERENLEAEQQATDVLRLVSEVENSTSRASRLAQTTADRRLRTELLDHQKRALTFMLQRESGQVPEEFRLWQATVDNGTERYVHRITRYGSMTRPTEAGGGVLADEMGMGKTLSTLALITSTSQEGHEWAHEHQQQDIDMHSSVKRYTQSTLVIVPSARWSPLSNLEESIILAKSRLVLINSWKKEISKHIGDDFNVISFHGRSRNRDLDLVVRSDMVLTTYKTLASEKTSPLEHIKWFRVVLDEAHYIRRPATTFHRACANLHARSRWCLTGTPVQNRLEDVGSLLMFLRAEPFHNLAQFRRLIVAPFEQRKVVAKERLVMLYDSLILRQTKDILVLPGKEEHTRILPLSDGEKTQYDRSLKLMNRFLHQQIGGLDDRIAFTAFHAHLQLRIFCNHGTYQPPFSFQPPNAVDEAEARHAEDGREDATLCVRCQARRPTIASERREEYFTDNCGHFLCGECWGELGQQVTQCPRCRRIQTTLNDPSLGLPQGPEEPDDGEYHAALSQDRDASSGRTNVSDSYFMPDGHSTKMAALVGDLKVAVDGMNRDTEGNFFKTKSIVFTCWTHTLDLVERYLGREGIEYYRIDGKCPLRKRQLILDDFSRPGGKQVLLMTTGTGAFGLNLTAANHIFIIEPQWNPSLEDQAIARAIRINQQDKVIVTRYIMSGTVEEAMQNQQKTKRKAAQAGFSKTTT